MVDFWVCLGWILRRPFVIMPALPHGNLPTNLSRSAALERTYLAYFRTALNFAMLGVFIAQLFSLQHMLSHDSEFGFFRVGLPLSCACYGVSIIVSVIGAFRFWRQQQAMANSKVYVGGWELNVIALFTAAVSVLRGTALRPLVLILE